MNPHQFDPISALLGVLAVAAGIIVIGGTIDPFAGADVGVWITAAVLVVGLLMLPWGARRQRQPAAAAGEAGEAGIEA